MEFLRALPTSAILEDMEDATLRTRTPAASLHVIFEGEEPPPTVPRERSIVVDLDKDLQVSRVASLSSEFQVSAAATVRDAATGATTLVIQGSSAGTWRPSDKHTLGDLVDIFRERNNVLRALVSDAKTGQLVDDKEGAQSVAAPSNDTIQSVGRTVSAPVASPRARMPWSPYRNPSQDGTRVRSASPPHGGLAPRNLFQALSAVSPPLAQDVDAHLYRLEAETERVRHRVNEAAQTTPSP